MIIILELKFSQVKHEAGMMLSIADNYRDERARTLLDEKYGEGFVEFAACTIEAFYMSK